MNAKELLVVLGLGLSVISTGVLADVSATAHEGGDYASDAVLTTKIKTALLKEKNLKSLDISVETTNGIVTLSGSVPSSAEIDQAVDVTKHVRGVKDVHNDLHLASAQ